MITQTRVEDAIASTADFLYKERAAGIDGDFAAPQVAEYVQSVGEAAQDVLTSTKIDELDGFYLAVGRLQIRDNTYHGGSFDQAITALPGHFVLLPGGRGADSVFYPAVVSEDGIDSQQLRLHVLLQPYRQQTQHAASMLLSGAGQSETKGVGACGSQSRLDNDGLEAEHFPTLLAAASDDAVYDAWQSGRHINHDWRQQPGSSVTAEVSRRLFGADIPQTTVTITRNQIESGQAMLLWHEGMRDEETGAAETATKDKALIVVQALGFEALQASGTENVDKLKRLLA